MSEQDKPTTKVLTTITLDDARTALGLVSTDPQQDIPTAPMRRVEG